MPIASLAADLAYALHDMGDAFTHGANTGYGKLRREPINAATDSGIEKVAVVTTFVVSNSAITAPMIDETITIAGTDYKIRDAGEPLPDGTRHLTVVAVV